MIESKKIIWVLLGLHPGDNAQAQELAARLDARVIEKPLAFTKASELPNWRLGASLKGVAPERRAQLAPPWPDMVIATGKRTAPVARWIKAQSGSKPKLVQLGRPRARLSAFDLVITTPQYRLPRHPNVLEMPLPFARLIPPSAEALAGWHRSWQHLPRPWTAVLLGAEKPPLRFGGQEAVELAGKLNGFAQTNHGSFIIMASPRTAAGLVDQVMQRLHTPAISYGVFDKAYNPYQSALQLADTIIVTSDSISMLSEAVATTKPVYVYRLPVVDEAARFQVQSGFAAWLGRMGLLVPKRRLGDVLDKLQATGQVGILGESQPQNSAARDDSLVMQRVQSLLA